MTTDAAAMAPQAQAAIAPPPSTRVPPHAPAARTTPAIAQKPDTASAVGSTVFALILIVALIFGLAWLARRMPGVGAQAGGALRIVGSLALSPRERVVVVDVGGQQLLLSTGTGGTRLLQALDTPLPTAPAAQPFKPFAQVLAQQFGRKP